MTSLHIYAIHDKTTHILCYQTNFTSKRILAGYEHKYF